MAQGRNITQTLQLSEAESVEIGPHPGDPRQATLLLTVGADDLWVDLDREQLDELLLMLRRHREAMPPAPLATYPSAVAAGTATAGGITIVSSDH